MKLSRFLLAAVLLAPVALVPATASADAKGDKVLQAIDKKAAAFEDQSYTATMDIFKGGTKRKTLVFDMSMKGLDKQYIVFLQPGDVTGMKILMNGDDLWMYSPEFKKVRKVAAHAQQQGFLGSEFTAEDMVLTELSRRYHGELAGQNGNITTLLLTAKDGVSTSFPKLEVDIDKTKGGVTTIRYYNDAGDNTRTQSRGDWKKIKGQPLPTKISMKNHKTGAETVISLSNVRVNMGVPDDLFTRRTLLRG